MTKLDAAGRLTREAQDVAERSSPSLSELGAPFQLLNSSVGGGAAAV